MTAEEMAREAAQQAGDAIAAGYDLNGVQRRVLAGLIRNAIVAAVEAERERCAKVAEEIGERQHKRARDPQEDVSAITGELIAAAIRNPPIIGARSTCKMCNAPICFDGKHWAHLGTAQPRHPATPENWLL